ncbi:MAG TPA: 2-amino-3,7-dideoxy-D-threo-hept-6-ulosonate synthase [Spirochaetota bacterium]|nr:2-amino-3,7-dideoxy-D-threo-hept-6-ulosonate synthase [Spirochaetota bacterium]HOL56346.1 2-amino-3,7-dideoxy-D-threo-hept-6-ulosonate synthase [Spirochaetota bacterium]HPP03864.1 2-amino-3,7-dideoxy-D-threo-hept-6-ulosonate synthase [Spirochaetota bacterium]
MIGKQIRLERLINRDTGKTVIVPMDHGVTMGPIEGLVNMKETIGKIVDGGVNAVVLHKGIVKAGHRQRGKDVGLFLHLSASTILSPDPNQKVLICTVEEAIKLGADGISIHINLGAETDYEMLKDFGKIGKECSDWGMPLLAMMYTRGKKIPNEFDVEAVKLAARVANELGADMVKVNFTGDTESFMKVVEGCSIPVLIAGGEKAKNTKDILKNIKMAMDAGAKGVSIGRNVFQHINPTNFCKGVSAIVHENKSIEEALRIIGEIV